MFADDSGDLGFMESMIALMAVITVLAAFLGAMATVVSMESDPTDSLDVDRFTGIIENGVFTPHYLDYAERLIDVGQIRGISIGVSIPGGYADPVSPIVIGEMDGDMFSRDFTSKVDVDDGRSVLAVFEVILWR